jgi:GxxExxY protein
VFDEDGTQVGHFVADLVVEQRLVVELKSVNHLMREHEAQLLGYLRGIHLEHGMLLNFGAGKFQVRKFALRPHTEPIELDVSTPEKGSSSW